MLVHGRRVNNQQISRRRRKSVHPGQHKQHWTRADYKTPSPIHRYTCKYHPLAATSPASTRHKKEDLPNHAYRTLAHHELFSAHRLDAPRPITLHKKRGHNTPLPKTPAQASGTERAPQPGGFHSGGAIEETRIGSQELVLRIVAGLLRLPPTLRHGSARESAKGGLGTIDEPSVDGETTGM